MKLNYRNIGNAAVYLTKSSQLHELSYSLAGRLQLANTGWLALQVPSALVRGAFDALHEPGIEPPPNYSILIVSPDEFKKLDQDKVSERGHSFRYTLGPVRSHEPNSNGISKTWYIQIYSPELKQLRISYGLSPYPKNSSSFQLPIAVRKIGTIKADSPITKVSEYIYLQEPNWEEYQL